MHDLIRNSVKKRRESIAGNPSIDEHLEAQRRVRQASAKKVPGWAAKADTPVGKMMAKKAEELNNQNTQAAKRKLDLSGSSGGSSEDSDWEKEWE